MIRYASRASRLVRQVKLAKVDPVRNFSRMYTNKDDEANRINALDRLILIKPAISEEEDEDFETVPEDAPVDLDGEPDPRVRLSKELLKMGRVYYRHIADRPGWFQERKDEICSNRTAPQIRRCLKEWMLRMEHLDNGKYRDKPLIFGDIIGVAQKVDTAFAYGPEETIAYAHYFMPSRYAITERILKDLKNINPKFSPKRIVDFGCGPATGAAAAYAVWGDEVQKYTGVDMSQSMLDAARIMTRDIIKEAQFFDKSAEVIKRAEQNNERFDLAIVSYTLTELVSDPSRRAAVQIMFELLDAGGHIVFLEAGNARGSHTVRTARQLILDIFNNTNRSGKSINLATSTYNLDAGAQADEQDAAAAAALSNEEEEDEYGDEEEDAEEAGAASGKAEKKKKGHHKKIHKKTTALILPPPLGYQHDELGAFAVAPCTHDRVCPLGSKQFCVYSQKVYSGMIRKESQEKFSYVILQKRPKLRKPSVALPELDAAAQAARKSPDAFGTWVEKPLPNHSPAKGHDASPLNVLKRFVDVNEDEVQDIVDNLIDEIDWNAYNPTLHREEFARLLRSPLKMKGHVTMDLCHPSGSLIRNTLSRGNLLQVPSLYVALRKTSWGGLFPALMENDKKSALAVKEKGNKNKEGEGRRMRRLMASGALDLDDDDNEEASDMDEDEEDVYGLAELRENSTSSSGGGRGAGSRRLTRSERLAEARRAAEQETVEEEEEEDEEEPKKKRRGKKNAVKVLIPGSPEARAFEEKILQRRRNAFTHRPIDKDTWYPEVDSTNAKPMNRKTMARFTRQMPEYADGINYADVKALQEMEPKRRGRRSSGLGSALSRIRQKRKESGDEEK